MHPWAKRRSRRKPAARRGRGGVGAKRQWFANAIRTRLCSRDCIIDMSCVPALLLPTGVRPRGQCAIHMMPLAEDCVFACTVRTSLPLISMPSRDVALKSSSIVCESPRRRDRRCLGK